MINTIKLQSLTLSNFKGVQSLTITPDGNDFNIFGENASGKTTVYDAFLWLLFDKDSSNRTVFSLKTLDSKGEALHGLDHTVEAILEVDGKPLSLKKTLSEKWPKKRGDSGRVFTGHETFYWIDDVPVKAGGYKQAIDAMMSEDLFRLITNPRYFNVNLSWQDRRQTLMEICGDVSQDDVIAANPNLSKLAEVLDGKTINDFRKIVSERIKKLNDDIAKIPIRIDELQRSISNEEPDYDVTERQIVDCKPSLERIEKQMVDTTAIMDGYREKQQVITKLISDMAEKKTALIQETNAGRDTLIKEENNLTRILMAKENDLAKLETKKAQMDEEIAGLSDQLDALRAEWYEINNQQFHMPGPDELTCLYCGREFTSEKREEHIAKAKSEFTTKKQASLAKNVERGKTLKDKSEKLFENKAAFGREIAENIPVKDDLVQKLAAVKDKLQDMEALEAPVPEDNPEYKAMATQLAALQAEFTAPANDLTSELLHQKRNVMQEMESLNAILAQRETRTKTTARIEELKREERKLAEKLSELEGYKFLTEEFIKAKTNLLEDQINSRFKMVTFKLFETQINGGLKECCEALITGVPYADTNNAAKINAGLDIIQTLAQHYGVNVPIFIDNAEAVNELLPIDSQVIRLVVSSDKELRTEVA